MYDLYRCISSLCEKKGTTIGGMCRELGISKGAFTDLKMGRKKSLSAQTLGKIATYFCVSVDYLLGMEDESGLTPDAWKQMGSRVAIEGEIFERNIDELASSSGVPIEVIDSFIEGNPIDVEYMDAIAYACKEDPSEFYGPMYKKLKKDKYEPEIDDEALEYAQAVHDRPELKVLFKKGKNATPEKLGAILALLEGNDEN